MIPERPISPHQMETQVTVKNLIDEDPRSRCCCELIHCKTGAYIVGDFSLIIAVCWLVKTVSDCIEVGHKSDERSQNSSLNKGEEEISNWTDFTGLYGPHVYNWVSLSCCGVEILSTLLLFVGLVRNGSVWLIPFLVTMILKTIGIVGAVVVVLIMTETLSLFDKLRGVMGNGSLRALALLTLLGALHLNLWSHSVLLRCYQYFENLNRGCLIPPDLFDPDIELNALTVCEEMDEVTKKAAEPNDD